MKEAWMQRAIWLAKKGEGMVSPNPLVGCVIVKDGRIIGEGWHEGYGKLHAERNALAHCVEDPKGAEMYVTLEPCCHYGKTPPCTEAILSAGITKVYVGSFDPNPKVAGGGMARLREAGVEVVTGVEQAACDALNEIFFHFIQKKMPFVAMKYAMTLDGKIATATGESQWVTGEEARNHVQLLRKRYSAILVGIGTALADDPLLTCRIAPSCNPLRVLCDRNLRIPLESKLVQTAREVPLLVVTETGGEKKAALEKAGAEVLVLPKVTMGEVVMELGKRNIDSLLVEGGSQIHGSFLSEGLVQKVYAYVAPKLLGGEKAPSPVGGAGIGHMAEALCLQQVSVTPLGEDFLITGSVK